MKNIWKLIASNQLHLWYSSLRKNVTESVLKSSFCFQFLQNRKKRISPFESSRTRLMLFWLKQWFSRSQETLWSSPFFVHPRQFEDLAQELTSQFESLKSVVVGFIYSWTEIVVWPVGWINRKAVYRSIMEQESCLSTQQVKPQFSRTYLLLKDVSVCWRCEERVVEWLFPFLPIWSSQSKTASLQNAEDISKVWQIKDSLRQWYVTVWMWKYHV